MVRASQAPSEDGLVLVCNYVGAVAAVVIGCVLGPLPPPPRVPSAYPKYLLLPSTSTCPPSQAFNVPPHSRPASRCKFHSHVCTMPPWKMRTPAAMTIDISDHKPTLS